MFTTSLIGRYVYKLSKDSTETEHGVIVSAYLTEYGLMYQIETKNGVVELSDLRGNIISNPNWHLVSVQP